MSGGSDDPAARTSARAEACGSPSARTNSVHPFRRRGRRALAVLLAWCTATAQAGVELPQTDAGRLVLAYLAAFNEGEEAMRQFEIEFRGDSALRTQSVEQRLEAYRPRRARWGKLTPLRVVKAAEWQIVLQVGTSESGEMLDLHFEFEPDPPHKLDTIWVDAPKERESIAEPALRDELLRRAADDQRVRTEAKLLALEAIMVDAANTIFMKDVVEKRGWPGRSMVGVDGANAAWILVQHADADPEFQRRCLALLEVAYSRQEATGQELAYLTDRVLVSEGKPQLYGTQFRRIGGELKPLPIKDEAHVDDRRREMGLSPLSDYTAQMRALENP